MTGVGWTCAYTIKILILNYMLKKTLTCVNKFFYVKLKKY